MNIPLIRTSANPSTSSWSSISVILFIAWSKNLKFLKIRSFWGKEFGNFILCCYEDHAHWGSTVCKWIGACENLSYFSCSFNCPWQVDIIISKRKTRNDFIFSHYFLLKSIIEDMVRWYVRYVELQLASIDFWNTIVQIQIGILKNS